MRTIVAGLAWGLCAAVGLSACGTEIPEFTDADVCGVGTELVADVLGSRNFEVKDDSRSTMPFDGAAVRDDMVGPDVRTSCRVSTDDASLSFLGEIVGADDVRISQTISKKSDRRFDHAGGIGAVRDGAAAWACGRIRLLVEASGDIDPTIPSLQAATEAFADVTGCWSGEAS